LRSSECSGSWEAWKKPGFQLKEPTANEWDGSAPRKIHSAKRCGLIFVDAAVARFGLSTFIVYSTWAAFQGTHYYFGNYISPFYSPGRFRRCRIVGLARNQTGWPGWLFFTGALHPVGARRIFD
jgi:hypothetical protein